MTPLRSTAQLAWRPQHPSGGQPLLMALLTALADLLLPSRCGGCGDPGGAWCRRCAAGLAGTLTGPPGVAVLRPHPAGLPAVVVAGAWQGELRRSVLAYKERGVRRLARPLGHALRLPLALAASSAFSGGRVGLASGGGRLAVVGIPASRAALAERGHDHLRTLLRSALAGGFGGGLVLVAPLAWTRQVVDQAGLGAAQRRANLEGALRVTCRPDIPVLLVDDVVTTGATLAEAARALSACGVRVLGAAALAATGPGPWPGPTSGSAPGARSAPPA